MPKYKVNGRTFNIPDNEVDLFEADFPEAQLHYQTNDGRKFTIYANERKDFLSDFPDATELGWSETIKEQAKQADPFQPEDNLAQPMYGSMSYQDNIGKPEDNLYYPSPLSEEGRADYEPITAEERSKQEYEMLMRHLDEFNAANGDMMDTYEAYEKAARHQVNEGGFAIDTPERRYLDENNEVYHARKEWRDDLNERIKNNSYFNQMRMAEADAANETVDAISNLMAQNEAENTELHKKMKAMNALAMNPRGSFSGFAKTKEMQEYIDERADLETAKRLYENTAQVYAAPINNGEDILKKFGKGFGQRVDDADFWSMGIIGIADDMNARAAFQKIQDKFGSVKELANLTDAEIDALLTPSEQLLISAVMDNNAALYARKDNTAGAYEAGAGAADSLMFMAQFLLTGGVGDAATVGTAAHRRLVNWLGRKVGSMSNGLMKNVARGAVKLGVGTAESIGKALVMTPLMPHTYANIADNIMSFDDKGELMDVTDAILTGAADALIETWSESTGDFVNKVLGVPGDITKGIAKKALKNVDFSDWGRMANAPIMKILRKGGFNGFLGEMGEEFIGNAVRSISGLEPDAFKEFTKLENLLVTAGSFAPMTIFGLGVSGAQYGWQKRKLDNAQKAFEAMLREASYTEDQARFVIDELLGSTDAHLTPEKLVANFSPLLRELAFNDKFANNRTQALNSAIDLMWQIARYRTFDGVYHRQEEQQMNDMLAEIQEGTGREFWATRLSENAGLDGTAYETDEVRAVEFNDGRVAYVLGGDGVNNTVVYNDGQTGFLSEEQLNEGKANGSIVSDATMGLNDYLTQQVARVRMTEEEQRMFTERNSNIGAVRAQFPIDATVELGTTEAPIQGVVRQQTPTGVIVESPAGVSQLTWEELGRTIGIEVNPQTDAQMEEEAINNLEIADLLRRRAREQRRAQRNTAAEAALEAEQMVDEAENEGLEKPIPMKADGTVDQTAFWNESPARWAQWKTEQRQDGGAYASTYIQNAIGILEGQIAESEAAFLAESDFDAKDALEQTINQQKARLAELQDLAMQYMPSVIPAETSAEASAEQTQPGVETSKPAAVMADRQKFELDAEYQRRLSLAKTLAEKEMILKEYFEAISAGSMEAVVMNKQNYKQIMKDMGCDESAIEEVTNAIKEAEEENKAVNALHVNDKIFVIAEYNYTVEQGRVSYVHERQHNITKRNPDLIQRVLSLGLGRETLQKIVRTFSGTDFYDEKSDEVLADEILSSAMEIAYTFDDFSVTLSKLGLPIELINLINEINDEQRNDFTLANARRNTLPRNDRQGSSRQDVGDQGEVSGGILGEEGDGSQETGLRGTESGEPATGGAEASEEGLQVPVAEVDEEPEEKPEGPDFRVTKPEDNLSDETKKELADKGLVMDGGAIMSDDYAELKHELGYETPIERNTDLDDLRFSYGTRHAHIANYLQHPEAEQRVVNLLERLAERLSMNELVFGVISKATKHTYGKKLPGSVAGPLRSNVEYIITFDLDTSCPRTFQYLNLVKRIERRIGRPLTRTECIQLIEMMRMYGQQIPCVYCYAENKRQALKQYYTDFIEARHGVLSAATDEEALEHMYGHTKEQSNDPKIALTEAAYNVFVEWRKNPKGMYNPTIKMLWNQYTNDRNSILTLLDTMLADKGISIDATDAKIAASVAAEFGVTNAKAKKVIEEIVAEWKWDVVEGKEHDQFTPVEEDDWGVNERALEVWRDMTAYAKSASSAKSVIRYTPYTDELKEISQEDKDYINGMGGVRMHSSNDFRIDYVFDYFQFMADMALYKMFGHTYTKSPEFVRIFGNSGYKINMSIAAYQDENGKIRPNADEGFDWEEAKALRLSFPNAGTMLMATSDEQIQMALDSDWIDMCIPFHHSGLPKAVWYNMRMWQDYTSIQKELFLNSGEMKDALKADGVIIPKKAKADEIANLYNEHFNVKVLYDKKGKRIRPHFLPGPTVVDGHNIPGHNNDHQRYLDLCREYGVKPRFAGMQVRDNSPEGGGRVIDVTEHPRYMIFIKETARTDSPQTAIQFNFDEPSEALGGKTPMEYAFDELEARAMAESELEGGPVKDIYNSLNKDQFGIADQFIGSIIKHKNETGEDYPLDYITPESREWFLVQRKALEEAFKDVETIPYHRNEYDEQGNLTENREGVIDLVEEARKADLRHRVVAEGTLVPGHKKGQPMLSDAEMMADVSFRITAEQDKAYMDAVKAGDMETAQRMVIEAARLAMPNTKVVDENGNPKVVYHGSTAMFTIFDKSRIGSATGTADGRGFYFTTDRDYALGYKTPDGQLFEVFLNIEKPLSYDKKTITKAQLRKILKEADKVEYEQEGEHYMLSNYANYNDVGIDGAVNEGANLEYDYADNDVELVGSLIGGSGSFDLIMDAVKKVTGKSGMIAPKDNGTIHYVVTDPAGIKSAEPVTYDDKGNVIPLSERFNPENEDIRFRVTEEQRDEVQFRVISDALYEEMDDMIESLVGASFFRRVEGEFDLGKKVKNFAEFADLITIIKNNDNYISTGSSLLGFFSSHTDQHFPLLLSVDDKALRKQAEADLKEALSQIDDTYILFYIKEAWKAHKNGLAQARLGVKPNATTKFNKAIDARIEEIRAGRVKGTSFNFKKQEVSLDEIDTIFKQLNTNEELAVLHDKVMDLAKRFGIKPQFAAIRGAAEGESLGDKVRYDYRAFNSPAISDERKANIITHELIHSVTSYAFYLDDYMPNALTPEMREAINILREVYYAIRRDSSFKDEYGASSVEEMVAELSNTAFREKLKEKSLYQRILDAILKLFGVVKEDSAYNAANEALTYIIENYDENAFNLYARQAARSQEYSKWYNSEDVRFRMSNENQAIFVSNAARAVEGIKQEKATPEQWLKMLEKAGGLKAGEDKWMGLSDWLKASDKKTLTKQEVLDFINEHMIVIEEQHYEEDALDEEALWYKYEESEEGVDAINYQMQMDAEAYAERELADSDLEGEEWEQEYERLVSDYIEDDLFGSARSAAKDAVRDLWMEEEAPKLMKGASREINSTRINYTTEGLDNLHEIALTVPTIESWNKSDDLHFGDAGDGRAVAWIRFGETRINDESAIETARRAVDEASERERAILDKRAKAESEEEYRSLYPALEEAIKAREEAVRAWNKAKDDAVRKTVLVIDEIQSKRHQEGRDRGYLPNLEKEYEKKEAIFLDAQDAYVNYLKETYNISLGTASQSEVESLRAKDAKLQDLWEIMKDAEGDLKDVGRRQAAQLSDLRVPDAPFDKNWHELAMKRMLRYAAENGYDVIAWTTGDQQNQRYALGGVVSSIDMAEEHDGFVDFLFNVKGQEESSLIGVEKESGIVHLAEEPLSMAEGKPLAELVGKEVAERMMQMKENEVLDADNLRIGGEGMKGFYDKMLPAFMRKYGKKWGVTVEDINLPNLGKSGYTMHSVPVTEEMKSSVMEGQVMFRTTAITPEVQEEMDAIHASAIVMGNFMKAPNGKDTNLTEEQWLMVRTKSFKSWFGLWEENFLFDNLLSRGGGIMGDTVVDSIANSKILDPVIASIPVNVMNNLGGKKRTAQMLLHNIPMFVDVMTLSSTDADIFTFAVSAMKVIALTRAKLSSTESTSSNGKLLSALDTLQDNLIFSLASLASTRKLTDASIVFPPTRNRAEHLIVSGLSAMFTDIHNLNNLGIKDSENIAKYQTTLKEIADAVDTNASKIVDENGEPLVIWRGMTWDIMAEPEGEAIMNDSSYFSNEEHVAKKFGDYAYPYFMNARNPYIMNAEASSWSNIPIEYAEGLEVEPYDEDYPDETGIGDIATAAFSKGYDAVWVRDVEDMGGVADQLLNKNSNQIKSATDNTGEFSEGEGDIRFKVVTDPAKIEELESGPKIKVYRAMQLIDGKLYPPMSAKVDGQLREPIELGQWEEAEERPDLADNKGYFKLDKGNKKSIKARYNPYFHTSPTPLNDQFSSAQSRPELVTVEVEIPASELTSGYKADKAKDSVGEQEWKAGVIQGKLSGTRKVILSRWDKPVRIVPDSEVADEIVKMFEGKDIVMPSNVVTPSLRAELEKRGVPFAETDNNGKPISEFGPIYEQFRGKPKEAVEFLMEKKTGEAVGALNHKDIGDISMVYGNEKAGLKKIAVKHPEVLDILQDILDDATIVQQSENRIKLESGRYFAVISKDYLGKPRAPWLLTSFEKKNSVPDNTMDTGETSKGSKQNDTATLQDTVSESKDSDNIDTSNELDENTSFRVTGTPTEDVVAEGVSLSPAQLASLAGDIFTALPEESRKKITDGLNGNILGLQDAILQIPTSLATKENWNDEDRQMAEVIAEQMTKVVGIEMTRPFSASEALWTLYNAVNKSTNLVSEASRALVRRNLGFDSQTLEMEKEAKDGVRFRTVGNASANASASMYNRGAANVWTRLKEVYVDMHASVEKLVKAIEKRSGKKAEGFENILMALNQQSSKGLAAMEAYEQKFLNEMFDEIRWIMDKTDFKYEDIVRYVILKHGLERNEKMAQRDAKAHYQEIYDDIIAKIKGMNPAQKRTYLTNAQLRDADAKAELARLQGVNTSALTPDQLRDHKKELAKAKKEASEAAEHLVKAQKVATLTEQDAQDELDKIFKKIERGTDSVYKEMRKNDYSGISSMFYDTLGVDRKNYATEEEYQSALMQAKADKYDNLGDIEGAAQMEVTLFENTIQTNNLWKSINKATKETLRQQYEANMISKDQYLNLRDMFEFYVPLRGFADNTAEDMYTYYRRPNSTGYTKPILGAEGRKTEAESPFGWIAAMAGSAIASNVKNEAKLALYYFVANRPDNGIATLSRTWFVHTPGDVDANGKKIFRPAYPPFNEDLSSASAKADYEIWQANMRNLQAQGLAYEAGQRLNLGNSVVNISDTNKPEHIVNVKVGGKDYTIVINGNPRAAQAINGDLNIETNDTYNNVLLGPWLRWLSSVNTSYNPEFWATNMMRDVAFTIMAVSIKGDPNYRRKFFKNYRKALKVVSMVVKNEKGTLGNSYIEQQYKDFVKYGGVTGFTQIKDSETWEKEIEKYLKNQDADTTKAIKAVKDGLHAFHRFGESLEQVSRFAAFLTAVETGKSINEAINDAKEITVNFNRKGSGKRITIEEAKLLTKNNGQRLNDVEAAIVSGISYLAPIARSTIMFFNASVQALNAWFKLWKANKLRSLSWVIGYATVGVINALIHALVDDDDEYLDIPQYERRSSLMLGGNGVYFKWALPQEMSAFYALGELSVETIFGRNPHQSAAAEAVKVVGDMLPVNIAKIIMDKGGWVEAVPSQVKPFLELIRNEDYKGDVIFNEQKWLSEGERERTANWESAYKGTGRTYIEISKLLNNLTDSKDLDEAGWINIHPESLEHVVESMAGGVGRTVSKLFNFITAAINPEEDVTVKQTPFLNRFLTINDERYKNVHVNDVYDYYAAEAEHAISLQKQYTKDRNSDALKDLRSSEEYKWARIYSKYKKPIKKYQEAIRAADTTNERMELMKQQDELKRKMIKKISDL